MDTNYSAKIIDASREFSAREKLMMRDFSNATQLDATLDEQDSVIITPKDYAVVEVHNEKSKDKKNYNKYVIIDSAGNKFVTGSNSFFNAFMEIYTAMAEDAPGEEYSIECYKRPSKNYQGKNFITCSLI